MKLEKNEKQEYLKYQIIGIYVITEIQQDGNSFSYNIEGGSLSNDQGGSRSMFPISGYKNSLIFQFCCLRV